MSEALLMSVEVRTLRLVCDSALEFCLRRLRADGIREWLNPAALAPTLSEATLSRSVNDSNAIAHVIICIDVQIQRFSSSALNEAAGRVDDHPWPL